MTSPVNHSEDTQHIIQGEDELADELDPQTHASPPGSSGLIRTTSNHCY